MNDRTDTQTLAALGALIGMQSPQRPRLVRGIRIA